MLTAEILFEEPSRDWQPAWSPDGVDGEPEIWTMNTGGSNAAKLASGSKPHWSPDGAFIVFQGAPDLPDTGVSINMVKISDRSVEVLSR